MRFLVLIALFSVVVFSGCEKETTQDEDLRVLQAMLADLNTTANSVSCDDSSTWTFTAAGAKACGGPSIYIPYSTTIDTVAFLEAVQDYTDAEQDYNEKWGISSDCQVLTAPSGVECVQGVPSMIF